MLGLVVAIISILDDESDNSQIIKNDTKPAEELCAETDLSSFSRFTRSKCVLLVSIWREPD
jgi:hypothetical protein